MKKTIRLFFFVILAATLLTCPSFAGEGRIRLSTIANNYTNINDIEAEISFGRELAARILGNYKLLDDEKIIQYVNYVGKSVALFSGRLELKYHFGVLESDEINAFAAPGGYIFITSSALAEMDSEAELAAVIGHEIAHITERHVIKELSIKGQEKSFVKELAHLISGTTGSVTGALEQALDKATEILFKKGYKAADEIEADRIGMLIASEAGYSPLALKKFLQKVKLFEKQERSKKDKHPIYEDRIHNIEKTLTGFGLAHVKKAEIRERFHEIIHQ